MDNGYTLASLEQNVETVMGQLTRWELVVVYDEITPTANIVPARNLDALPARGSADSK